jgi:hypothetical protein
MDARIPTTPPQSPNGRISGSFVSQNSNNNNPTSTSQVPWSSARRRREKREKSIQMLQEEIRKQLEEEQGEEPQNIIITPTKTRSLLSSQRWIQIQAEAMVQAAIRAEEEVRQQRRRQRRGNNDHDPPLLPPMNASQIAEYSHQRAREIIAGNRSSGSGEADDATSAVDSNNNRDSVLDMESRVIIQARALEHAITQSQINDGIPTLVPAS